MGSCPVQEEEEKAKIQKDLSILTDRLSRINESLARKHQARNEYDKTISGTCPCSFLRVVRALASVVEQRRRWAETGPARPGSIGKKKPAALVLRGVGWGGVRACYSRVLETGVGVPYLLVHIATPNFRPIFVLLCAVLVAGRNGGGIHEDSGELPDLVARAQAGVGAVAEEEADFVVSEKDLVGGNPGLCGRVAAIYIDQSS